MAKFHVRLGSNTGIELRQRGTGQYAWFTVDQGRSYIQTETTKAELLALRDSLDKFLQEEHQG